MATIFSTSRLAALLTLDVSRFLVGTKLAETALFQLGSTMQNFGRNLIRGPLVALGFLSAQAIRVAADFDELTSQLRAVSGGSGINDLTENARRLGRTTKFTATEIQNLQVELAKLGFETDSIIGTVANAANITQVFGGDLVKTGNTIAEVTRQFTRENLSATRVADVMAVAFSKTALNTENFAQAMKNVGSIANITNNDFVSTVSLLGLLANAGQKSGIAGTRLKGVLIRLSKELGVTGKEIDFLLGGQLTFNELIEFFRNRAGVAAAVVGELGDEFGVLRRQIDDSNGASSAFASTVEGRLFFNIDRLKAATEDLAITFGSGFTDLVSRLATGFEQLADSFSKADPSLVRFGSNMALLLTIIPAVNFILGGFLQAIASLKFGLGQAVLVISLLSASFARGLTVYATTSGALKKVKETTDGLLASLDKKKVQNVENLEQRIKTLRTELEALSSSDIDGDILAAASSQFSSEIQRLEGRLQRVDDFSFRGTIQAIERVRSSQSLQGKEINTLLLERSKLEGQILNARTKQLAVGGDTSFLGREVKKVKEQLEQELEFTNLEIAFRKLEIADGDKAIEDLKEQITTADLSFLNIPQLEAEIIKYQELLDDAKRNTTAFNNTLSDVTPSDGVFSTLISEFRLLEIGLAKAFSEGETLSALNFLLNPFSGLSINVETLESLNKELDDSVDNLNLLNEFLGNNQDELLRQQQAVDAVVASYADFNSAEGLLGAGKSVNDLFASIKKATAAFGEQSNKLTAASAVIAQYTRTADDALSVANLISQITDDGFDLDSLFSLGRKGGLDDELKFVKDLASAFRDLAVDRLVEGQKDLASRANDAADALERQAKFLEGFVRRRDIRETVEDSKQLALTLNGLGRLDALAALESEAGTLRTALRDALINPEDSSLADDLLADLILVEQGIKKITDQDSLNSILDRDIATKLTVNAAKVAGGFGDLSDSYSAAVSLEEGRLSDLLTARDAGNIQVSSDVIQEATQRLLDALDAQRIYEFTQSLEEFKTSSKDAADAFLESVESGDFKSKIDEFQAGIDLLQNRIRDAKTLLAAGGDSEDGFLANGIEADLELLKQLRAELERLQFAEALTESLTQGFLRFGNELVRAQQAGEEFGDALINTFKRVVKEILVRLAILITAFLVLSAFGVDVGSFGSFIGKGFSLPSPTSSSGGSQVTGLLAGLEARVSVEGAVSGNNIVIANQRGTRAIDRTFG